MRPKTPPEIRAALRTIAQEASFHLRRKDGLTTEALAGILMVPRAYIRAAEDFRPYVPMKVLRQIIDLAGMEDHLEIEIERLQDPATYSGTPGI